jgi:methylase of polypeptide subunit release factors
VGLLGKSAAMLTCSDVNPVALQLAQVNAALAGCIPRLVESDLFAALDGAYDLILANPPYLMDDGRRAYRDGGEALGAALSLQMLMQSLDHLSPGGRLVLYTGSAIVGGVDRFAAEAAMRLARRSVCYRYCEIDPDVFGEELERPAYGVVDRIAAVGLIVTNDQ